MATPRSQRIGIWIITIVMAIGAVGVYFVAILANNNDAGKKERQQQLIAEYQAKEAAQNKSLSDKYYGLLSQYLSRVHSFEKEPAEQGIVKEDLVVGDGEEVGDDTKLAAYYIGWNPDGKIYDQSIDGSALKAPLGSMVGLDKGLKNASLIQGWKEGMKGMKLGGVREITIPSSLAYGESGQGSDIPPNTPIKFIVLAIPVPDEIPIPEELLR